MVVETPRAGHGSRADEGFEISRSGGFDIDEARFRGYRRRMIHALGRLSRLLIAGLLTIALLTGCVSATNVTFESNPPGAAVYVDGRPIGETPATERISNGIWSDPAIRMELDGHEPESGSLDKELKVANLIIGIFFWPALLWVYGPDAEQYARLYPTAAGTEVERARPDAGELVPTQVSTSLSRILGSGTSVRLTVVEDAGAETSGSPVDAIGAALLEEFGDDPLFSFVDRDATREILDEIEFQQSGLVDRSQLSEYGRMSGATHLLVVTYERSENDGVLTVSDRRRLLQIETGNVIATDVIQITLLWNASSGVYEVVSSTYNNRPVRIVDGRIYTIE